MGCFSKMVIIQKYAFNPKQCVLFDFQGWSIFPLRAGLLNMDWVNQLVSCEATVHVFVFHYVSPVPSFRGKFQGITVSIGGHLLWGVP
mmetsp:Transcript_46538/g.131023  ORF Transcript_46538/g.131023 Transcript_46538/m.131023 type:complete len:88 (-) Transcript_46538:168-431(-)